MTLKYTERIKMSAIESCREYGDSMENILKMGYAIEVKYKDGSVYTKYFAINQVK